MKKLNDDFVELVVLNNFIKQLPGTNKEGQPIIIEKIIKKDVGSRTTFQRNSIFCKEALTIKGKPYSSKCIVVLLQSGNEYFVKGKYEEIKTKITEIPKNPIGFKI